MPHLATSLDGVTVIRGHRTVLDTATFTFQSGEKFVIYGRSGSGKTTVLNLLAGYMAPESGSVTRPRNIGYLLQRETLFNSLTPYENLAVAAAAASSEAERSGRIRSALADVGVDHLAEVPVSSLSGGERQRVELARLLLVRPSLVLLDEPTSSLDPPTRREVLQLVAEAFTDATIVVSSHDPAVVGDLEGSTALRLSEGRLHEVP